MMMPTTLGAPSAKRVDLRERNANWLSARDTLRLEVKYCLYGQDINETTTPLEVGLR